MNTYTVTLDLTTETILTPEEEDVWVSDTDVVLAVHDQDGAELSSVTLPDSSDDVAGTEGVVRRVRTFHQCQVEADIAPSAEDFDVLFFGLLNHKDGNVYDLEEVDQEVLL